MEKVMYQKRVHYFMGENLKYNVVNKRYLKKMKRVLY